MVLYTVTLLHAFVHSSTKYHSMGALKRSSSKYQRSEGYRNLYNENIILYKTVSPSRIVLHPGVPLAALINAALEGTDRRLPPWLQPNII